MIIVMKTKGAATAVFATHRDDQDVTGRYPAIDADGAELTIHSAPDGSVTIDSDGVFHLVAGVELTAVRRKVEKLAVVDRLVAGGFFAAAMAAMGGPGSLLYERWSAASYVYADDADLIALLTGIGADPAVILA